MILSPKQLSDSVKRGDGKRLYMLAGNDSYITGRCVAIIQRICPGCELLRFDALETDEDRVSEAFFSYPFDGNRMVVINNYGASSVKKSFADTLETLIAEIPDFLNLILIDNAADIRTAGRYEKKISAVQPSLAVVSVSKADASQGETFIAGMARREGASITRAAARLLFEYTGGDLQTASVEIKKLAAFSDYGVIEENYVRKLTVASTESNVYDMIRAIENGDSARAMLTLNEMLEGRTEPLMITAVLNTAYINLCRAKHAKKKKLTIESLFSLFDYKKGDRKVSIAMNRERNYTEKQIDDIIKLLFRLDTDLKSSPAPRNLLLEQAVSEIITISSSRE